MNCSSQAILAIKKERFSVENYCSEKIIDDLESLVLEIAGFYRYIFCNEGHYLVYPSTGEVVSPQQVFRHKECAFANVGRVFSR